MLWKEENHSTALVFKILYLHTYKIISLIRTWLMIKPNSAGHYMYIAQLKYINLFHNTFISNDTHSNGVFSLFIFCEKHYKDMKTEHITYQNETFKKKKKKRLPTTTTKELWWSLDYIPHFRKIIQKGSGNVLCMSLFNEKTVDVLLYWLSWKSLGKIHSSDALKLILLTLFKK